MTPRTAELCFRADEPSADGHFPGNPIIPGAVLLREVARTISADRGGVCLGFPSAKFLHPVRPGDRMRIAWETKGEDIGFVCSADEPDRRVLIGTLRLGPR